MNLLSFSYQGRRGFTRLIWIVFIFITISACSQMQSNRAENTLPKLTVHNDFFITNWQLTGPFYSDSLLYGNALLGNSIKADDGVDIDSITSISAIKNITGDFKDSLFYTDQFFNQAFTNPMGFIDFKKQFSVEKTAVVYMCCTLKSKNQQDVAFLLGNDDACSLYLNGKNIYSQSASRKYRCCQDRVFAQLNKGDNFLLVRLGNIYKSWMKEKKNKGFAFSCNLCSVDRYYNFYNKIERDYLENAVVPKFFPLQLKNKFYHKYGIRRIVITDTNGAMILETKPNIGDNHFLLPRNTSNGLYYLEIEAEEHHFKQPFFYGDIYKAFNELSIKADCILSNTSNKNWILKVKPLLERYRLLHEHYSKNSGLKIKCSGNEETYYPISDNILSDTNYKHEKDSSQKITSTAANNSQLPAANRSVAKITHCVTATNFLTFPSRWFELNTPEAIRVQAFHKQSSLVSELRFYKNDMQFTEVFPKSWSDTLLQQRLSDNNINSTWLPKNKALEVTFNKGESPDFMSIVPDQGSLVCQHGARLVYLYSTLHQLVYQKGDKQDNGSYIGSFISPVDHSEQYYMAHVPDSLPEKLPLVIQLPVVEHRHFPYLKSTRAANTRAHQLCDYLAKQYNCLYVLPALRTYNHPVTAPIAETDLFALIDQLKKDYAIDTTQISLLSFCGAAPLGFNLTQHHPGYFAAHAVGGGIVSANSKMAIRENCDGPWANMEAIQATPTYVLHSETDDHSPLKYIANHVEEANRQGADINFEILSDTDARSLPELYQHQKLLTFLLKHKAGKASRNFGKNDKNGASPLKKSISRVLGSSFVVVQGTIGTKTEQQYTDSITQQFIANWQQAYDVVPRVIHDRQLTTHDVRSNNLVLIGNQHSNSFIKEIYPQLPLKVNTDYLKLNNKKYTGKALGYWLAIPNPQNPKQSILLIGGNDLSKVKSRKGIPAEDGCYEFEVVEYKGNEIEYQDWGWITEEN